MSEQDWGAWKSSCSYVHLLRERNKYAFHWDMWALHMQELGYWYGFVSYRSLIINHFKTHFLVWRFVFWLKFCWNWNNDESALVYVMAWHQISVKPPLAESMMTQNTNVYIVGLKELIDKKPTLKVVTHAICALYHRWCNMYIKGNPHWIHVSKERLY